MATVNVLGIEQWRVETSGCLGPTHMKLLDWMPPPPHPVFLQHKYFDWMPISIYRFSECAGPSPTLRSRSLRAVGIEQVIDTEIKA